MSKPDPVAISPDEGPLPPIYVPPKGQPSPPGQLWHLVVRAVRLGGGWAARHLDRALASRKTATPDTRRR